MGVGLDGMEENIMKKGMCLVLFLVLVSLPALGAPICLPRDKLVKELKDKYGEVVEYIGILGKGEALMEIWVGENRSWSIMLTPPKGLSCIMAVGTDWQEARHKAIKGEGT